MKHLLPKVPKYFKTNLHTHSTHSDGKYSPAEMVKVAKDEGYISSVKLFINYAI